MRYVSISVEAWRDKRQISTYSVLITPDDISADGIFVCPRVDVSTDRSFERLIVLLFQCYQH